MKIVQINATSGIGSTGKIAVAISELLNESNIENYIFASSISDENKNNVKLPNETYIKIQAIKSKVLGNYGFNSISVTKKIINKLEEIKPDIVHLHNIHGHDCNLEILFKYFKKTNQKLYWTFHDCWAFTGYCPYFDLAGCDKWETECKQCPQRSRYSLFFDYSKSLYNKKKQLFSGLDLTIITPSQWLASLLKKSFLKDYPVKVINNGIDLNIFKPTDSDFRKKYNCEDKFILLGVAFGWGKRKGLDVFIELSKRLDSKYQIVLVGTDDNVDKQLPSNIISIHRTKNQQELAEIYSAADLFVNPTREENYPTVNMEAIACGTPVVTFKTGGSPECIDEICGVVIAKDDIDALEKEIIRICNENAFSKEDCIKKTQNFNKNDKFTEYINLYKEQ